MLQCYLKKFFSTIAIDIGITNTYISVIENNRPRIIENTQGSRITPTYIHFNKSHNENKPEHNDNILYGLQAKNISVSNKDNTFYGFNMLLGRKYNDNFIKDIIPYLKYKISCDKSNNIIIPLNKNIHYTPQYLTSMFINYIKKQAEQLLGQNVSKCIVTLPSFINNNNNAKKELNEALTKSQMKVLSFIDESIASVYSYCSSLKTFPKNILVINMGGIKTNISLLSLKDNNEKYAISKYPKYVVRHSIDNFELGGTHFDKILCDYLLHKFKKKNNIDLYNNKFSLQRIINEIEKTKIELNNKPQSSINIPFITVNNKGIPLHFNETISKPKYELLIDNKLSQFKNELLSFKSKHLSNTQIDNIILIGGTTRTPLISNIINKVFPTSKILTNNNINPEEAPCLGCSLLINEYKTKSKEKEYHKLKLNKMPLSFGIEVLGGKCVKIIEKETFLPMEVSRMITTVSNEQPKIEIKCFLGERPISKYNIAIGTIELCLPLAVREGIKMKLYANCNNEGILTIGVVETVTKKTAATSIDLKEYLTSDIINKSLTEAQKHKIEDDNEVKVIDTKVQIDKVIYDIETKVKELKLNNNNNISILLKTINNLLNENNVTKAHNKLKELITFINKEQLFNNIKSINTLI